MKKLAIILFLLLIALSGCGQDTSQEASQEVVVEENQADTGKPAGEDNRKYTLEQYLQINVGDSYEDVCGLLGNEGEAMVNNERLKQYEWKNEDETYISVTFYDSTVTAKTQYGLGPFLTGSKMVTKAKYERLKEGLSLKEVTDILGPGTETLMTTGEGQEKRIYLWQNEDGGTINVTFEGNKVTKISEMMLK